MAELKWYGDRIAADIHNQCALRVEYAARAVRDHIRVELSNRVIVGMGSMRSQQAAWFRARAARRVTAFARQLRKAEALGAEGAEIASYLRHERGQAIRARELAARRLRAARRQFVSAAAADYPRMRTGHLRRNVQMEMDRQRIEARVGTNVVYGRYLEFGTSKMAARPWLSRGFRETAAEIRRILTTPIGSPI